MASSSDESSSSDEELDQLSSLASKIMTEKCEDEENMDTDSDDSDADSKDVLNSSDSSSEGEMSDDQTKNDNQEELFIIDRKSSMPINNQINNDSDIFTVDRKPMTQSDQIQMSASKDYESRDGGKFNTKSKMQKTKNDKKRKNDKNNEFKLTSEIGAGMKLPGIYINVQPWRNPSYKMDEFTKLQKDSLKKDLKVMEKSVITPDFEQKESLPKYHEAVRKLKRERKKLREMTKGKKWFDLPATDLTDENKKSLMILQMRKAVDPKRFYKSNDRTDFPKYSQFGTIVEGAADFYSSRIPKKQRKQTLVDELLADAEFRTYNKKKYEEIQSSMRRGTGVYDGSKRMINKKKGPLRRKPDKNQKKFFVDSSAFKGKHKRK